MICQPGAKIINIIVVVKLLAKHLLRIQQRQYCVRLSINTEIAG